MNADPRVDDPAELIAWYAEMGVDIALDEEPVDRFAAPARAPAPVVTSAPAPSATPSAPATLRPQATVAPSDDTAREAREIARAATRCPSTGVLVNQQEVNRIQ